MATGTVRCSLRLGNKEQEGLQLVGSNVLVYMMMSVTIETSRTGGCDAFLHAITLERLALSENMGDEVIWNGVVDGRN